jgi:hypothetical protein
MTVIPCTCVRCRLIGTGIAVVEPMCRGEILTVVSHLSKCPVTDAHVWAKGKDIVNTPDDARWPTFCHTMRDVLMAPYFFERALGMYPIARDFFQELPFLYSVNAFWTQHAPDRHPYVDTYGHEWHRDGDDRKQLVMFVYGTDVLEPQDGAHQYRENSHLDMISDAEYRTRTILGPAGTTFISNTRGLHMGLRPGRWRRLLLWARWGVSDPPDSYLWDKTRPMPRGFLGYRYPEDLELQRAIRLVVA